MEWIREKIKFLLGGGAVGVFAGIHFLWPLPAFGNVVIIFLMKMLGTGLLAIISAMGTAFGTDVWKKKKDYWKKFKAIFQWKKMK